MCCKIAEHIRKPLRRLVAKHERRAEVRQLAQERLGRLDLGRVVQSKYTKNVASLEGSAGLLDQVDETVLCASRGMYIFMTSTSAKAWPFFTCSPFSTAYFTSLPGEGVRS